MPAMGAAALAVLVLAVLAGIVYQYVGTRRDARLHAPPGRLIDVGRGRLHLHSQGAGAPAVILEAGIAASSLSWLRVAPAVAEFARVHSYDRSGLGWSARTHTPISARSLAAELHVLLQAAPVPPPYVIVTHSYGVFVAQAFADRFAGEVAGLVFVDPIFPAEWLEMAPAMRRRLAGGVFLSRVGALLASIGGVRVCLDLLARGSTGVPRRAARLFGSEAAALLNRLVLQVQKIPPDAWPAMRAHWSRPRSFLAMADHLRSLRRSAAEIAETAGPGDIPLAVITAASQPPAVRAEHVRIAARSRRGHHVDAKHAGHWILLDEPETVVEAIRRVVDETRA